METLFSKITSVTAQIWNDCFYAMILCASPENSKNNIRKNK